MFRSAFDIHLRVAARTPWHESGNWPMSALVYGLELIGVKDQGAERITLKCR